MNNKPIYVTFGDKKIENEFEILKEGKFEDKQLYEFINRAIQHLKDIDAIDITFILGNVNGLRNFLFEKVTPIGIGMIETKRKFKQNFGFEVNLGLLK
ncbi:MAG: hypothetical protein AABX33_06585, partial [Nanoarchaeota archaeon]